MSDAGTFSRLYISESGRVARILRRMTDSREAAEDIVQDAFVKLSERGVGEQDAGLLVRTAQNLARDALRAERVRAAYAAGMRPEQVAAGYCAPEQAAAARQELRDLMSALESLPERTRRIFLMSRVDEVPYPRIARRLGVSVSTVEKEMIRALEFCRTWRRRRDLF